MARTYCGRCGEVLADSLYAHPNGDCRQENERQSGFGLGVKRAFEFVIEQRAAVLPGSSREPALAQLVEDFVAEFPEQSLQAPVVCSTELALGEYVEARWLTPGTKHERVIRGVVTQLSEKRVRIKYEWNHSRGRQRSIGVSEVWRLTGQVKRVQREPGEGKPGDGVKAFVGDCRASYLGGDRGEVALPDRPT